MIAVEVEEDLILDDLGRAPDVVFLVFAFEPDITLPVVRHLIVGEEDQSLLNVVVEKRSMSSSSFSTKSAT